MLRSNYVSLSVLQSTYQAVVVQMVTALSELVSLAESLHHHHQVSRPVIKVGAEADVAGVQHPHPVPHVQVAAHFGDGVPHLERKS